MDELDGVRHGLLLQVFGMMVLLLTPDHYGQKLTWFCFCGRLIGLRSAGVFPDSSAAGIPS